MNFPTRSVLQLNFPSVDGDKTSGLIPIKTDNPSKNRWNVGIAGEIIFGEIVHFDSQTVGKFITCKKILRSMMWQGVCHRSMQPWIITKLSTKFQW
jgi:hypothetical protein